jgi:tetratricopeptide (TPR) repeat protein
MSKYQIASVDIARRPACLVLAMVVMSASCIPPVAGAQGSQQQPALPQSAAAAKQNSGSITCPINPQTVPPLSGPLAAARDLYRTGKFDDAIAAYNAIIPNGGDDAAAAYAGLSRVYLKQKRVADAESAADKAVALTPNRAPAIVAQGEVLFRLGKLSQAEQAFRTPLLACNLDARAYLGLERIYYANLEFKTADKYIRQAYLIDPADPDIRREYMDALDGQEYIDFLKKYLADQTDDDAETRKNLGIELSFAEAEQKEGKHECKVTNNVKETETKMEPVFLGLDYLRGVGLNVKVNGVSGHMMIDTGASGITIDKKIAEKAGVKKLVSQEIGGIGDSVGAAGYIGYADGIQIGDLKFQGCYIAVVNKRSVLEVDGIVGADVFSDYLVNLNIPDRKVKLTQLPPFPGEPPSGAAGLATSANAPRVLRNRYVPPEMKDYTLIMLFGHNMLIPTFVNKTGPSLFVIDSGSWDSLIDLGLARQVSNVTIDRNIEVRGLSGDVKNVYRTGTLTLQFSHFQQQHDDVVAFDLTRLSDDIETQVSGLLGFTVLNLLDIKIDYRDGLVNFTYDPKSTR